MISPEEIAEVVEPLHSKYGFARALLQQTGGSIVSANLKQTMAEPVPSRRGIVLSVVKDGLFYEASSAIARKADLQKLANGLQKSINDSELKGRELSLLEEEKLNKKFEPVIGQELELKEKISFARKMVENIKQADDAVVTAQVRFKQVSNDEVYVSANKRLSQQLSRFEAIFVAVLRDKDGNSSQIYDGYALQGGWEHMQPPEGLIKKMVADGKKLLSAPRLKPGMYDCIFSPSLSGILAHEAFGHGTEADTMVKNRARGSEYMNEAVASEKVNLYDSPALENAAASYFFDHEGQLASTTRIVEKGILNQPMTDHRSASVLEVERSPNGRRESYDHKIYTRMTNTYFMPGSDTLEQMIASIEDGYLVERATNGMEDPKSWGIQLEALSAERIKNGKRTGEMFTPVIVTGYVPDILKSISMVSDNIEIGGLGMCGKGYKEWVKVTDGGPYLKLRARLA